MTYQYLRDNDAVQSQHPKLFNPFDPDQLYDRGLEITASQLVVNGATDEVARQICHTLFEHVTDGDIDASLANARN